MAYLNSNVAHSTGNLSCSSSSSSFSSSPATPIKKRFRTEHDQVQSIFDLGNPESHRAVVLDNQKLFQELQHDTVNTIDNFMQNNLSSESVKNKLLSKSDKHSIRTLIQNSDQQEKIKIKIDTLFNDVINKIGNQSTNLPVVLQVGTNLSEYLHKDNGSVEKNNKEKVYFDYTIVIPVVEYDLSGNKNHNFSPQSTQILPMEFKNIVPEYDKKIQHRDSVFYDTLVPSKKEEIKAHLLSEPLQQGTAIILHTATEEASDDDSQSVIHQSPETPYGFARCFILGRANKRLKSE